MNWIEIAQIVAVLLNLGSMWFNMHMSKKTRKTYMGIAQHTLTQMREQTNEFQEQISRVDQIHREEIELLKTNEGLYDLRNNEKQYQFYLTLLRKK